MGLYVMETFGAGKYAELARNNARRGPLLWDANLGDVLGVDAETLYAGYLAWLRARYAQQLAPILADEHKGLDLFITSLEEAIAIVERLPDGRSRSSTVRESARIQCRGRGGGPGAREARKEERVRTEILDRSQRRARFGAPVDSQRPAFSLWPQALARRPPDRLRQRARHPLGAPAGDEWPVLGAATCPSGGGRKLGETPGSCPARLRPRREASPSARTVARCSTRPSAARTTCRAWPRTATSAWISTSTTSRPSRSPG